MSHSELDHYGKLVLRLTVGILLLIHGIAKVGSGVDWLDGMLMNAGLPVFLKWGAYVGEVVAPLLVIFGVYARVGGALIIVQILFAIGLAHPASDFITINRGSWALETQAFFLFGGLAIALFGSGRFGLNIGKCWN